MLTRQLFYFFFPSRTLINRKLINYKSRCYCTGQISKLKRYSKLLTNYSFLEICRDITVLFSISMPNRHFLSSVRIFAFGNIKNPLINWFVWSNSSDFLTQYLSLLPRHTVGKEGHKKLSHWWALWQYWKII